MSSGLEPRSSLVDGRKDLDGRYQLIAFAIFYFYYGYSNFDRFKGRKNNGFRCRFLSVYRWGFFYLIRSHKHFNVGIHDTDIFFRSCIFDRIAIQMDDI